MIPATGNMTMAFNSYRLFTYTLKDSSFNIEYMLVILDICSINNLIPQFIPPIKKGAYIQIHTSKQLI